MPNITLSWGWPARGALGRSILTVVLGVALLGATSVAREFDLSIVKRREITLLYLEVLPE